MNISFLLLLLLLLLLLVLLLLLLARSSCSFFLLVLLARSSCSFFLLVLLLACSSCSFFFISFDSSHLVWLYHADSEVGRQDFVADPAQLGQEVHVAVAIAADGARRSTWSGEMSAV